MTPSIGHPITGIVNSRGNFGFAHLRLKQLVAGLRSQPVFKAVDLKFTSFPGHAVELTRHALTEGADVILSIGGDGTHNEVVSGFFDRNGRLINSQAKLVVLHLGTGGDFRKSLGISASAGAVFRDLAEGTPCPIDIGLIRYIDPNGRQTRRYFVNIASFGISGIIDNLARDRRLARLGGKAAYLLATLQAFRHYRNAPMGIKMDSDPELEQPVCAFVVANGRFFGGGMKVAPHAVLDDGLFDAVCLGDFKPTDFLLKGHRLYRGTHLSMEKVWMRRVRTVAVRARNPVPIDIDGDGLGYTPAEITVAPERIFVIVGKGGCILTCAGAAR
ncbi:MAG: diacylglycerol kinase family protein [Desulfobacterales bacterium]